MAAIFLLPVTPAGQRGPVAAFTSTAGWAAAGARVVGPTWIATPDGLIEPARARGVGSAPHLRSDADHGWAARVPLPVKTLVKDARRWRQARRFVVDPAGPWSEHPVDFVWQRHDLFHRAGIDLARALDAPLVLFVPATVIWEARQWGVDRPGWGALVERLGERPALLAADLVACGSQAVADEVQRIGVPAERILITPTGVDLDLFDPAVDGAGVRRRHALGDRFVVGWTGSFRRFHALELLVEAAARVPGITLLLVGDGPERPRIEALAQDRGVDAVFTGTVAHQDLPEHLAAMDVAVLVTDRATSFHYSPLKLAEYLAAGRPVVAPAAGALPDRLHADVDAVLVKPGDDDELVRALTRLRDDPAERERLGRAARGEAAAWSWDHQVHRVLDALHRQGRP